MTQSEEKKRENEKEEKGFREYVVEFFKRRAEKARAEYETIKRRAEKEG